MQVTTSTTADWTRSREALAQAVAQVTALLRSVTAPGASALGGWSVAEVAMHLSQAWLVVPGLADDDLSGVYRVIPSLEGQAGHSLIRDLWDLGETTRLGVQSDPERDLRVLADRIDARAAAFLADATGHTSGERRAWLVEGTEVPLPVLTAHLLNETIMHGYDIARVSGRPWPIEPAHAAMVLDQFIVPVFRALDPSAMVDPERGARATVTFDLRIRGGRRFFFVFDRGELRIEDPSDRRVDCHVSAEPVALLLVAWGRRSQWSAIARGQLLAWGRRPWMGPQLRRFIRNP